MFGFHRRTMIQNVGYVRIITDDTYHPARLGAAARPTSHRTLKRAQPTPKGCARPRETNITFIEDGKFNDKSGLAGDR